MGKITIKEIVDVMDHISRKAKEFLGENPRTSEATDKVYEDIYRQALRESGEYQMEYVKPEYLYAMHEAIDGYDIPAVLLDELSEENNYAKDNSTAGNHELD